MAFMCNIYNLAIYNASVRLLKNGDALRIILDLNLNILLNHLIPKPKVVFSLHPFFGIKTLLVENRWSMTGLI